MCGIFAYIGSKNDAATIVLEGLKRLEYRGYDSWGISVKLKQESRSKNQAGFILEKHTGKIGNAKLDSKFMLHDSNLGIGHTRWATHGGVTDQNAHPHLDCTKSLSIVHNGIVENNGILKAKLLKQGHKFLSETDTEVISHLIEEYVKKHDFEEAVRLAFNELTGLNAIVAADSKSETIIVAKNGSPLVIGKTRDEIIAASDPAAVIPHTRDILFLEDGQMAVLNSQIKVLDLKNGKNIKAKFTELDWKIQDTQKGKFEHFLLKEIHEQPHVIENSVISYKQNAKNLAALIKSARGTFMLGCGTASYAALAGTYLFSNIAKVHVNFSIGSEFSYLEDYLTKNSLLIPISQSGETIDVIDPVTKAKKKGSKIACITNVMGSTLYRISDDKFLLNAGPEKAVVSTKAFIAMYSLLLLTAYSLIEKEDMGMELLLRAADNLNSILRNPEKIKGTAEKLKKKDHVFVIGRGLSYVSALEASLKLKETAYVHAEGFAGGELKHGVIALIEKGTPCIVIAPNDQTYDEIISNAEQLHSRGAFIIGIGPRNHKVFDTFLETGDLDEATFISQIVIAQLLSYYIALARGLKDPDKPRNLAKSVTVK